MIWHYIQTGWRPVLEILILTLGIYYAFRFVRGTAESCERPFFTSSAVPATGTSPVFASLERSWAA